MATNIPYSYASEANINLSAIDPFLLDDDLARSKKPPMVENNMFNIPLSPPTSPRLASTFQQEQGDSSWQEQQQQSTQPTETGSDNPEAKMPLVHSDIPSSLSLDTKPMLRTHKSFPYTLGTGRPGAPDTPPLNSATDSPSTAAPDDLSTPDIGGVSSTDMPSVTFGGSAPASPLSNMTPTSPHGDDELGLAIDLGPEDGEKKPMSAAEIRAQKRKMKRFRFANSTPRRYQS